jgi:transposase InsO family protein
MTPAVEARIVDVRRAHPGFGPRTILTKLRRELDDPPSRSAIYRCLVRHRLIDPAPRRRKASDYRRWERSRAMELRQIDVMGGVRMIDGSQVSVVTGIDDHSRFCVMATLVERATARPVCDALLGALKRHGLPEQILTDNGKVFVRCQRVVVVVRPLAVDLPLYAQRQKRCEARRAANRRNRRPSR